MDWSLILVVSVALTITTRASFTAICDWESVLKTDDSHRALQEVQSILLDVQKWKHWNSFTYDVVAANRLDRGIRAGDNVMLSVHMNGRNIPNLSFTVLSTAESEKTTATPDSQPILCWSLNIFSFRSALAEYLLGTRRCMHLRYHRASKSIQIKHEDENFGILAPLVGYLYKDRIEEAFSLMNGDLRGYLKTNALV